ncbi:MAG: phosphonate transporter, permease protein PhnE 2 [Pseudomonadota bacterium]|jgi:phosphonate transport system permease protein
MTDTLKQTHDRATAALASKPKTWTGWLILLMLLALLAGSWKGADMRPMSLIEDSANMATFLSDFFPPNFRDWEVYLKEMIITIQIAVWGTALAIVLAIPCGLLCAENITPAYIHQPMRRLMDAFRAVNEMVFALLFIVAVGLGPFAGVLALFISTTGTLAKLFSEAVEAIDPQPVDGIRATGANSLEEITYGVIPQVLPLWISYALYRFEANVRGASVLGIVGAGGIGQVLWEVMRGFQYAETCALLIILIASVSIIDFISARIRALLI